MKRPSSASGLWLDDVGCVLAHRVRMLLRLPVTAETGTHRRENLFSKGMLLAGAKSREQRRGQYLGRHRLVDGGVDGPAAFAGIFDKAGVVFQGVVFRERRCRQVEQPGRDHAAAPPYLGDVGDIEIETMILR